MILRARHRRLTALFVLFALLFQQVAMAAYICPMETGEVLSTGSASMSSQMPMPCHPAGSADAPRCHQHCHPLASAFDPGGAASVPSALLPARAWVGTLRVAVQLPAAIQSDIIARATAPPLNLRFCSFQI